MVSLRHSRLFAHLLSGLRLAIFLAAASVLCGPAIAADGDILFSVPASVREAMKLERVRLARDDIRWRFAGELFEQGPALPGAAYPVLVATPAQAAKLATTRGVSIVTHGPVRGYGDLCPTEVSRLRPGARARDIVVDDGYHDQDQVAALLAQFESDYPDLAKRRQIGTSHEGRAIWALKISDNVSLSEDETAVVFDGNIHAREYPPTEVCLDIIHRLLTRYATDSQYRAWVNDLEIFVVPCLNPDGRHKCETVSALWRKNARDNNANGQFDESADGVDLNRNSPFFWGSDNTGSSPDASSYTYRGPHAESEPETQAILGLLRDLRPAYHLTMHSYWGGFYSAYGDFNVPGPEPEQLDALGQALAAACVDENGAPYSYWGHHEFPYTVNGDLADSAYATLGVFSYGIELGLHDFRPLYATTRDQIVPGVRGGWELLLDAARDGRPRLYGVVTDSRTGQPLSARIELLGVTRPNDEHWETRADGRYEAPVRDAGAYQFRIAPIGHPSLAQTREITFASAPVRLDLSFDLSPPAEAGGFWTLY